MSKDAPNAVSITILGKEYLVACQEDEKSKLLSSASYLDRKMREIRDHGKVIGTDRIAVMAALNIAHELLHDKGDVVTANPEVEGRIRSIQEKIEEALYRSRQLELEA
ncbi:MAG: cell division protein ZapA [Gammaproteobacteria bacterium]|nr:cell division protein ZapA [Gammaproteobacteria bacterium]